jgi:phosphoenolpyruvate synthase/pyruvate phosphate dikinase
MLENISWFGEFGIDDVQRFGGKNASLSEMQRTLKNEGVRVPDGFATAVDAYRAYVATNDLAGPLQRELDLLRAGQQTLAETGAHIRRLFLDADFPDSVAAEIRAAYSELCKKSRVEDVAVAVRSSATAEDLPEKVWDRNGPRFAGAEFDAPCVIPLRKRRNPVHPFSHCPQSVHFPLWEFQSRPRPSHLR